MSKAVLKQADMFKAVFKQAAVFRHIMQAISTFTEVNFDFGADGISFQALDSSHIMIAALRIDGLKLKEYKRNRPVVIGLKVDSVNAVLKLCKQNKAITLSCKDSDAITFEFAQDGATSTKVELKAVDIDAVAYNIPIGPAIYSVTMASTVLRNQLRDIKEDAKGTGFGQVELSVDPKGLTLTMSSQEMGRVEVHYRCTASQPTNASMAYDDDDYDADEHEDEDDVENEDDDNADEDDDDDDDKFRSKKRKTSNAPEKINVATHVVIECAPDEKPVKMIFSAGNLNKLMKASVLSKTVRILFKGDNFPLQLSYNLEEKDSDVSLGTFDFYIAPKIVDEDL